MELDWRQCLRARARYEGEQEQHGKVISQPTSLHLKVGLNNVGNYNVAECPSKNL